LIASLDMCVCNFFKKKGKTIEIAMPYTKISQATATTAQTHDVAAYNLQKNGLDCSNG
jgi:hypothetical protein